jgi:hypothetical protein
MKAVGIDLTNALAEPSNDGESAWLPNVVLPLTADEPVLAGVATKAHRRGAGLSWPPECQIPYGGVPQLGKGRVTVAEAWRYLAPFKTQDLAWDNYQPYQRQISWQPDPSVSASRISLSAEDIIYEAVKGACSTLTKMEHVCLVVPDDLGEGAQQALLDRLGSSPTVHLLPRPVAIASDWCNRRNAEDLRIRDKKTGCCGFIWVLSMGLDRWEFCPVEIWKAGDVLIPVRDHTQHSSGIAVDGLSMLAAYAIGAEKTSLDRAWQDLMTGDLALELVKNENINCPYYDMARQVIHRWPGTLPEGAIGSSLDIDAIRSDLIKHGNKFGMRDNQCLGVIADGSLAHLKIGGECIAQKVLADAYDDLGVLEIFNGRATRHGAEIVATQMHQCLPTYRDRIAPILIYYMGRDEYWDPKIATKELIDARTVAAGEPAKTDAPIAGFYIEPGSDSLSLVLGRQFGKIEEQRKVDANLREIVTEQEDVEITAEVRPGQGFASAFVTSVRPGFFETKLNWRTMEEDSRPPDPNYAWPTGMVTFKASGQRINWQIDNAIEELSSPKKQNHAWESVSFLSCNTMADILAKWKYVAGNVYESPLASHDTFSSFVNPDRLYQLSKLLGVTIGKYPYNPTLFRLAGWMYQACPEEAKNVVLDRLNNRELEQADPEVIGKSFCEPKHIKLFSEFLAAELEAGNRNYHWIRSFRDLIRLRVNALRLEVISINDLNKIEQGVLNILEDYKMSRRSSYYNASLYLAPHLLKRRRFDPDFLKKGSTRYNKWMDHLLFAIENRPQMQQEYAAAMIPFLTANASDSDLLRFQKADASI